MDSPRDQIKMSDFPGIITGVDPRDLPAGGTDVQTNLTNEKIGELRVRAGFRVVTFEDE